VTSTCATAKATQGKMQASQVPAGLESEMSHLAPREGSAVIISLRKKNALGHNRLGQWQVMGFFWKTRKHQITTQARDC